MRDSYQTHFKKAIGLKIKSIDITDNVLYLYFSNFSFLRIKDAGQCCCENRYMSTDDDLDSFIDAEVVNIELRDGPETESKWEVHQTQFLRIETTNGPLVIVNHNEHNGYYSGFIIDAEFNKVPK